MRTCSLTPNDLDLLMPGRVPRPGSAPGRGFRGGSPLGAPSTAQGHTHGVFGEGGRGRRAAGPLDAGAAGRGRGRLPGGAEGEESEEAAASVRPPRSRPGPWGGWKASGGKRTVQHRTIRGGKRTVQHRSICDCDGRGSHSNPGSREDDFLPQGMRFKRPVLNSNPSSIGGDTEAARGGGGGRSRSRSGPTLWGSRGGEI